MIFKAIGDTRPYPDHGRVSAKDWSDVPPRQVRLQELVTTKTTLDLSMLLSEDSTFYGDLFAHVVEWNGDLYLEDGLHRAVRSALRNRPVLHARVFDYDALAPLPDAEAEHPASGELPPAGEPPASEPFPPPDTSAGRHRSDEVDPG